MDCLKRHKLKKRFESDKIFLPQNNTPKKTSYNIIQLYEEKENQDCFEFLENKIREASQQMIERIYSEEVLNFLNRTASIVDEKGF